jgi:hypothetical protein
MEKLLDWRRDHDLTTAELFSILGGTLGDQIAGIAKYLIREERHGDQDKPGGLE